MARFGRSFPVPHRWKAALGPTLQLMRPVSDISAGSWTPSTGSDLYAMLDEVTADDADYITAASSGTTSEVKFNLAPNPLNSAGHMIRYRAKALGILTVYLIQGTTVIATHHPATTDDFQLYTFPLSSAEAAAITDYSDLRLRFTSSLP